MSREKEIEYEELFGSEREITTEYVEENGEGIMKWINGKLKDKKTRAYALSVYKKIADAGSVMACYNLGNCYVLGYGVERDVEEGFEWYGKGWGLKTSRKGINDIGRCESNCGLMSDESFKIGRGFLKTDIGRGVLDAMMLFNLSGDSPNKQALRIFFTTYVSGRNGFIDEDNSELKRIKAKHFPHLDILLQALDNYEYGKPEESFAQYEFVSREGNAFEKQIAFFCLGYCFFYGEGTTASDVEAFKCWRKGGRIDSGDVDLMKMLSNSLFICPKKMVLNKYHFDEEKVALLTEALKVNTATETVVWCGDSWNSNCQCPRPSNPSLTPNGGKALGEMFKCNSTIKSMDIYYNEIGYEGVKALAEGLKENSTLTSLHLGICLIGDKGAEALADALRVNTTLTTLHLNLNNIGNEGALALAEALSKRKIKLAYLRLENNPIGYVARAALDKANPGITW